MPGHQPSPLEAHPQVQLLATWVRESPEGPAQGTHTGLLTSAKKEYRPQSGLFSYTQGPKRITPCPKVGWLPLPEFLLCGLEVGQREAGEGSTGPQPLLVSILDSILIYLQTIGFSSRLVWSSGALERWVRGMD